ncbi:hypothetical protein [Rhizobacter sp. Root1221]|uniref:N-acyl amino acid synthase FeeM domain-containing protein n=1 Tax=Rhizobacter sp. Root1221 TaxID=1736433 RepID=UPI0012FAE5A1|nr:hypothetical protein [Rhizobacter sp. Root1221]
MLQIESTGMGERAMFPGLWAEDRACEGAFEGAGIDEVALPFSVHVVSSEEQLEAVQALREVAYGRHLPHLKASFGEADPLDRLPGTTIFYAEDKLTGEVVGSARIQTNRRAPLQIERSVALPDAWRGRLLAEITRLAVRPGYTGPVRLALVKASHLYCIAMQIGAVLAGSRQSLLRSYRMLGFAPLFEDGRLVPLVHAGGLPHHVLVRDMVTAEADARARDAADYPFVFRTYHPDIDLFAAVTDRVGHGLRPRVAH